MIVNEDFLSNLRRAFSLNLYEVKLWTALLSRGISTAGELSDIADVPRSRTYDVLESLERKGFVVVKPEKPIKYLAISPQEVLSRVQKRMEEKATERAKRLTELSDSDVLAELNALFKQGIEPMQATDFSGALKGRHNLYDHLSLLIKEAQSSIFLITSEEGIIRKVRSLKSVLEKAKERGVSISIVAPETENTKQILNSLKDIADIKKANDINARFCIVDGRQILLMLLDDKDVHPTYDLGMWISTPYLGQALQQMANRIWQNSVSFE